MAQVFISYNSSDIEYAKQIYDILKINHIDVWFAPVCVSTGQNFALEIGQELNSDDTEGRSKQLLEAKVLVLIVSKGSMRSEWVKKEVKIAIKKKMQIVAIQVDHEELTAEFEYLLVDVQVMEGYHLHKESLKTMLQEVRKHIKCNTSLIKENVLRFTESELRVHKITGGDPYYEEGKTLTVGASLNEFYLAPPKKVSKYMTSDMKIWCEDNGFVSEDIVFGETLQQVIDQIPIPNLMELIEESREKIFYQFVNRENGCYFNNKKYGIESINPFARTRDEREIPKLDIKVFITDYFTHRVMKDVCKHLVAEGNKYINQIDYTNIGINKVFFTSLGINLLLLEDSLRDDCSVLITSRSTNAAETYKQRRFSLSVIEGVSISDYDAYLRKVRLTLAVERGLIEELNVKEEMLKFDTLKFHDLFVNRDNLEMGISCTIELKKEYGISEDVLMLHGRDEELEISDKRAVPVSGLSDFIKRNQSNILPQAIYTLCSYMESRGVASIERYHHEVLKKESCIFNKDGSKNSCGDAIVDNENFIAVIDGATPKGTYLWNGKKGDVYVAEILCMAIEQLPPDIKAQEALEILNQTIKKQYMQNGIDFCALEPEEHLQASVLIYSIKRKEIWCFGDCMLRINQKNYYNQKKGDLMLADLRTFCIETAKLRNIDISEETDYGREIILPFLKDFTLFANSRLSFGYDVLNGGEICSERVIVYAVQSGDHIVMASDGYPKLFDTIEETEEYLKEAIKNDPNCVGQIRGTKGICKGNISYDDRCFIGFTVE